MHMSGVRLNTNEVEPRTVYNCLNIVRHFDTGGSRLNLILTLLTENY